MSSATGCRQGSVVELWTAVGGGHTWPGGVQQLPRFLVGVTSDAFSASQVSWDFFLAGRRGAAASG